VFSPASFEAFFRDLADAGANGRVGVEELRRIASDSSERSWSAPTIPELASRRDWITSWNR
jgi:hypothetical protein